MRDLNLTQEAQIVVETVTMLGGTALLVGGFVRDQVLGIESKDIDIEVHGVRDIDSLIDALGKLGPVDTVGVSFGVVKFGQDVDVSFPRRDRAIGPGHAGFLVDVDVTMTIEEALARRDFTINSMAIDAATGELFDPFGGMEDAQAGVLRHTSEAHFAEDPLRVLRAVQFASRFGFTIHPETARLSRSIVDRFHELSVERVWVEWEKIFSKGKSMKAVTDALVDTGWIEHFPEWGIRGRVTDRVLRVTQIDGPHRAAIILGAHFSDSPQSKLESFLKRIDAPGWLRRDSLKLAERHFSGGTSAQEARRISRKIAPIPFEDWVACHRLWGTSVATSPVCLPPFVTGEDLIKAGLTPGPIFGSIIRDAIDAQDIEGWTKKQEAMTWLSSRLN